MRTGHRGVAVGGAVTERELLVERIGEVDHRARVLTMRVHARVSVHRPGDDVIGLRRAAFHPGRSRHHPRHREPGDRGMLLQRLRDEVSRDVPLDDVRPYLRRMTRGQLTWHVEIRQYRVQVIGVVHNDRVPRRTQVVDPLGAAAAARALVDGDYSGGRGDGGRGSGSRAQRAHPDSGGGDDDEHYDESTHHATYSPSQRAMTTEARQLPTTFTEVRAMSMTASTPRITATASSGM